jgi:flagellar hook-associated protein 1 FlgK
MSGFSSKILSSALSGLNAQQAKIATASNNIANVNTPGYTRRRVETAVRDTGSVGSLSVGNGVQSREYLDYQMLILKI